MEHSVLGAVWEHFVLLLLSACRIRACEPAGSAVWCASLRGSGSQCDIFSATPSTGFSACVCTDYGQGFVAVLP